MTDTRHPCTPMTIDDYDRMPERFVFTQALACSPTRLFEIFDDAHAWTVWAPGLAHVEWTSPAPYGVGTTRTVTLRGGPNVYEEFIAWTPGSLMAFTFVAASEPIWKRFGERYRVRETPEGCELEWTVAYEPASYFAAFHPWCRPMMRLTLGWFMKRLARFVRGELR